MKLARRQFLQSIIASAVGWQVGTYEQVAWAADQYAQNLAQSTKRKLALLIGINQYDAKDEWSPLAGCITDVELQRELLIHRFGFKPQDILTLSDRQADRRGIIEAVRSHLISQALPDDVVVVHFSGHGSRVGASNSLIPADGGFPSKELNREVVNDLTVDSLFLLLKAIATEHVTCVLDTGYYNSGSATVGNFRVRSRPSRREWVICSEELALQAEFLKDGSKVIKPNTLFQAAINDQLCADATWNGFSSGVFTYALTQQLWQMTPARSLYMVLENVVSTMERRAFPIKESLGSEKLLNSPSVYDLSIAQTADGVVKTTGDDRTGEVKLTGLPISQLGYYSAGSILTVENSHDGIMVSENLLQVRSRHGLSAKVEVVSGEALKSGQLVRETIRVLPRNLKLTIALDAALTKIERVDAIGAISALPSMIGVNAGEQFADCLFASQSASYGLFTVGNSPILGSFGAVGESVIAAIRRLQPQLENLLAAKLIRLTGNQDSSQLAVKVNLEAIASNPAKSNLIASRVTNRSGVFNAGNEQVGLLNKYLTIGDRLCCHLENLTNQALHVSILSFDPRSKVLTSSFVTSPYANDSIISPHQRLTIPRPEVPFQWLVSAPQGLVDVQIIVSKSPLTQTSLLLEKFSRQSQSPTGMISIANPLEVAMALLEDLHQPQPELEDFWVLNVQDWATLGFIYRVA